MSTDPTWGFYGLNDLDDDDNRDGAEQDFSNGPQFDFEGFGDAQEYRSHQSTPQQRLRPAPPLSPNPPEAPTLDDYYADEGRRELERLEGAEFNLEVADQPVPLPYLERQQPDELDYHQTAHPTAISTPRSYDSNEFVTLEDSDSEDENEIAAHDMPPRRSQRTSVVDLTEGTPQQSPQQQAKRRRSTGAATASSSTRTKRRKQSADIEELDLANEAPSAEEELLQAQQQEAIRVQQQATEDAIPQKIGQRSCIICLENFTNCTATACGHFFCHECLIQALRAAAKNSDRGTGSCPVCRKSLKESKKSDVIPISFMTKTEYDKQNRRG